MEYVVPEYGKNSFTCPHCSVLAEQKWNNFYIARVSVDSQFYFRENISVKAKDEGTSRKLYKEISVSTCNACHNEHIWFDKEMIIPKVSNIPQANIDMPEIVKNIYNEAKDVFSVSAKAAAALLRLALQNLCKELGEKGRNINDDIGELVKKGLPVEIQQALDTVRIVGNNAVHPGELNLDDDSTNAINLFNMLNIIVENRIVQPKKIKQFYDSLPQNAKKGIENRDK